MKKDSFILCVYIYLLTYFLGILVPVGIRTRAGTLQLVDYLAAGYRTLIPLKNKSLTLRKVEYILE